MSSSRTLTDASLKPNEEPRQAINAASRDTSEKVDPDIEAEGFPDWQDDPENPLNWSTWRKTLLAMMMGSQALTASIATSIISPARKQIMEDFSVDGTTAFLPVTLYTIALGFGPVLGGPLSETIGRQPIYSGALLLGSFFILGAGLVHSFAGLCILRFLAGLCWAPVLSLMSGTVTETFEPKYRGPVSGICILMPFLGPGLGPVIGAFATTGKSWRWTQYSLLMFAAFSLLFVPFAQETFNPVIQARLKRKRGQHVPESPPIASRLRMFATVALIRPVHMMFFEPIVTFTCLYVACEFGTLFSFFAGVPDTFNKVYGFGLGDSGLVFLSIVTGCVFGLITVILCDVFLYRKQIPRFPAHKVPPEYRLYPALLGSIGLPTGLFWFAWTARDDIHWMSPTAAIVPFAWGNICIFIPTIQYIADTYHGSIIASAVSANGLARYAFAGCFPLFTIQMYNKLGIHWAASLLGFLALGLMPVPWVLFRFGPKIRAKSKYDTIEYPEPLLIREDAVEG